MSTMMINPGMIEAVGDLGLIPDSAPSTKRMETIDAIKDLLANGDIDEARTFFHSNWQRAEKALEEYDVAKHKVMQRYDKVIQGRDEPVKRWKLPMPYQKKIVNSAVAFLFGKAVNLIQKSKGTEQAFEAIDEAWTKMRMAGMNREIARFLFKETEAARLYYIDDSDKNNIRLKCMHLANSLGDRLYTYFDRYKALKAFAREYRFKEGRRTIHRFDVYTDETIYYCEREDENTGGIWTVEQLPNLIGKIPVAYYEQGEAEWSDVQNMIERLEWLASTRGDVNDATADPILVLKGEVISLPDRRESAKVVKLELGAEAEYLHPQMSVEMVKDERQNLKQQIHYCTDTPDLSMDAVGGVDGRSGEAIKMLFFSAMLKALTKQETFEPMLDREISIQRAFYKTLLMPELAGQFEKLDIGIDFGNPMPDNLRDMADVLTRAVAAGILSKENANKILSALLHLDEEKETKILNAEAEAEKEEEREQQMNRFPTQ